MPISLTVSCGLESNQIKLACVFLQFLHLGGAAVFSTRISLDELVSDLQDIIFEKNKCRLPNNNAVDIEVWKVS